MQPAFGRENEPTVSALHQGSLPSWHSTLTRHALRATAHLRRPLRGFSSCTPGAHSPVSGDPGSSFQRK
jgi:hypothetical protein